jgi:hypothetical protein
MTVLLTHSSAVVDLRHVDLDTISVLDIAHHLATINRFVGAASRPYSVAEHSLLVLELFEHEFPLAGPATRMAVLLHDAHKAYTGELSPAMKELLGGAMWSQACQRVRARLLKRFKLVAAYTAAREQIRWADDQALATERVALLPIGGGDALDWPPQPPATWVDFKARAQFTWQDWRQAFLDKFGELEFQQAERSREIAGDPLTTTD